MHNGIGCFIIGGLLAPVAAGRWRWSLLIVGVMLLLALTVLMSYLLDFVKGEFALFFAVVLQQSWDEAVCYQLTLSEESRLFAVFCRMGVELAPWYILKK